MKTLQIDSSTWRKVNDLFNDYAKIHGCQPPAGWKLSRKETGLSNSFICLTINNTSQLFALDHEEKEGNEERYLGAGFQSEKVKLVVNEQGDHFAIKVVGFDSTIKKEAFAREASSLMQMGYGLAITTRTSDKKPEKGYLLQKLFKGGTLDFYTETKLPPNECSGEKERYKITSAKLLISFLDDFVKMKQLGIIHGDLKPKNIMIDEVTSRACIIDYGTAINQKNLGSDEYKRIMSAIAQNVPETIIKLEMLDFSMLLLHTEALLHCIPGMTTDVLNLREIETPKNDDVAPQLKRIFNLFMAHANKDNTQIQPLLNKYKIAPDVSLTSEIFFQIYQQEIKELCENLKNVALSLFSEEEINLIIPDASKIGSSPIEEVVTSTAQVSYIAQQLNKIVMLQIRNEPIEDAIRSLIKNACYAPGCFGFGSQYSKETKEATLLINQIKSSQNYCDLFKVDFGQSDSKKIDAIKQVMRNAYNNRPIFSETQSSGQSLFNQNQL